MPVLVRVIVRVMGSAAVLGLVAVAVVTTGAELVDPVMECGEFNCLVTSI